MPRQQLPPDGLPPRVRCGRYIETRGRQCRAQAEPGDFWCRFHGGKAPSHEGNKTARIDDYRDQLMELADFALDTVEAKLTSMNPAVALRAALEVLDRAGVSTVRKSETHTTVTQKSELDEKIEQLLSGREADGPPAEAHATSASPNDGARPLPATSFSNASAEPPPPGGGSGLGLGSSGVSDGLDDEPNDRP